jgi:hypothetical protein
MRARLLLTILLLAACKKAGGGAGASTEQKKSALDHRPASANIVAGMNRGVSEKEMQDALAPVLALLNTQAKEKEAAMVQCGVTAFAKIQYLVVAATVTDPKQQPELAMLVHGDGLRAAVEACAKEVAEHDGKKIEIGAQGAATSYTINGSAVFVAWLDGDTMLGGPFQDAAKTEALAKGGGLGGNASMTALLDKVDTGAGMWGAVDMSSMKTPMPMPAGVKPKGMWFELTADSGLAGKLTMQMESKDAAENLKKQVEQILPLIGGRLPPQAKGVLDTLKVIADGDLLTATAKLDSLMSAIPGGAGAKGAVMPALIGLMAAVAIPSFTKYQKKAKSTEAVVNVKKIFMGAQAYYEETGAFPPNPAQAGAVPALGSCCSSGGKCAPNPTLWTDSTWQALKFSMDDPHVYYYEYKTAGTGKDATFSVDAYGDLDCNGVYSTFEMIGSVTPDGTVTGAAGLFRDKENE